MNQKVVVITGASSGIGESLAKVYFEKGFKLVLGARNIEKLDELVQLFGGSENALAVKTDVTKEEDCSFLITSAINTFGKIDVLICNAGISMRALFNETDLNVLHKVMDVNFWGTVNCIKHALPNLLKTKGSIIGISSIAGYVGLPGRTGYSASKFAMQGFLESIRNENIQEGLHVLVACPGFTASNIRQTALTSDGTSQIESPREETKMMQSEEVASLIYKAYHKRKRDLIITPTGVAAVWLRKLFPRLSDKIVFNQMAKEPNSPFKK